MRKGDILKIKGSLGFLYNPRMKVIEIRGGMALIESVDAQSGGMLSHLNQNWHGIELLERKLDKEYYYQAMERITNQTRQETLI